MVYGILTGTECLRMCKFKHAELFAKGKPIHPYSLQCKVLNILKYSSIPLLDQLDPHVFYPIK
jgi:hypothetical protein